MEHLSSHTVQINAPPAGKPDQGEPHEHAEPLLEASGSATHSPSGSPPSGCADDSSHPVHRHVRTGAQALMTVACLAIGVFAYRYLQPGWPGGAPEIVKNAYAWGALPVHASAAGTALILGPFQFLSRSGSRARLRYHRLIGYAYTVCCYIGAISACVLAVGNTRGASGGAGFFLAGLCWIYTTSRGVHCALNMRFAEHGRWMTRSFSICFAAVTLRSYLPLSDLAGMNQDLAYRLVAWLCWIPNVIVVELYLQGWLCAPRAKSLSPRSVSPAKQAPSFSGAVSSTQQH